MISFEEFCNSNILHIILKYHNEGSSKSVDYLLRAAYEEFTQSPRLRHLNSYYLSEVVFFPPKLSDQERGQCQRFRIRDCYVNMYADNYCMKMERYLLEKLKRTDTRDDVQIVNSKIYRKNWEIIMLKYVRNKLQAQRKELEQEEKEEERPLIELAKNLQPRATITDYFSPKPSKLVQMTSTPVGDIYQKLKKRTKKKLTRKHENRSVSSDDSFQTVIEKRATKKVFDHNYERPCPASKKRKLYSPAVAELTLPEKKKLPDVRPCPASKKPKIHIIAVEKDFEVDNVKFMGGYVQNPQPREHIVEVLFEGEETKQIPDVQETKITSVQIKETKAMPEIPSSNKVPKVQNTKRTPELQVPKRIPVVREASPEVEEPSEIAEVKANHKDIQRKGVIRPCPASKKLKMLEKMNKENQAVVQAPKAEPTHHRVRPCPASKKAKYLSRLELESNSNPVNKSSAEISKTNSFNVSSMDNLPVIPPDPAAPKRSKLWMLMHARLDKEKGALVFPTETQIVPAMDPGPVIPPKPSPSPRRAVVAKFAPRREEECSAVVTSQEILENDKSLDNANNPPGQVREMSEIETAFESGYRDILNPRILFYPKLVETVKEMLIKKANSVIVEPVSLQIEPPEIVLCDQLEMTQEIKQEPSSNPLAFSQFPETMTGVEFIPLESQPSEVIEINDENSLLDLILNDSQDNDTNKTVIERRNPNVAKENESTENPVTEKGDLSEQTQLSEAEVGVQHVVAEIHRNPDPVPSPGTTSGNTLAPENTLAISSEDVCRRTSKHKGSNKTVPISSSNVSSESQCSLKATRLQTRRSVVAGSPLTIPPEEAPAPPKKVFKYNTLPLENKKACNTAKPKPVRKSKRKVATGQKDDIYTCVRYEESNDSTIEDYLIENPPDESLLVEPSTSGSAPSKVIREETIPSNSLNSGRLIMEQLKQFTNEVALEHPQKSVSRAFSAFSFNKITRLVYEKDDKVQFYSDVCPRCELNVEFHIGGLRSVRIDVELSRYVLNMTEGQWKSFLALLEAIEEFHYPVKEIGKPRSECCVIQKLLGCLLETVPKVGVNLGVVKENKGIGSVPIYVPKPSADNVPRLDLTCCIDEGILEKLKTLASKNSKQ